MTITYENVTPSLIPNTTMQKRFIDGVHKQYIVEAVDGYVLHDNGGDGIDLQGNIVYRYSAQSSSCGANYDFSSTEMTIPDINGNMVTVTAYGSREFFAFPANLVPDPENNIYGGGGDHEVMTAEETPEND